MASLLKTVRELAYQYPDRRNPKLEGACVYQKGDQRCIVGEAIHQLGWVVPDGDLVADFWSVWSSNNSFQRNVSEEDALVITALQDRADRGTWGDARGEV